MNAKDLHKKLTDAGWTLLTDRGKGSHRVYEKEGKTIVVPFHGARDIGVGLAHKILKQAGLK